MVIGETLAAEQALIALGSNQPFRGVGGPALLAQALAALKSAGLGVTACSSVWATPAWPAGQGRPDYVNAVVAARRADEPEALFARLAANETAFGRVRRERWGPRALDLDILALGTRTGRFGEIVLPHPRLHERGFVLLPLAEIAPAWRHPILGASVADLLAGLVPAAQGTRLGPLDGNRDWG